MVIQLAIKSLMMELIMIVIRLNDSSLPTGKNRTCGSIENSEMQFFVLSALKLVH